MDSRDVSTAVVYIGSSEKPEPGVSPVRTSVCAPRGVKAGVDRLAKAAGAEQQECAWCGRPIWVARVTRAILDVAAEEGAPMETVCMGCADKSGLLGFMKSKGML